MATFASYDFLQVSRRGGSLVDVVLDRPKKLNALDLAMVRECADAVGKTVDLAAEGRCVAMALRGAGGKAFCAGGDVAAVRPIVVDHMISACVLVDHRVLGATSRHACCPLVPRTDDLVGSSPRRRSC